MEKIKLDFGACEVVNGKLKLQGEEIEIGLAHRIASENPLVVEIEGTREELEKFNREVYDPKGN